VTNIGTRPTFDSNPIVTEVHLIDFSDDLYGRRLELSFHARIRSERRFPGAEALARQIADDVEHARQLLGPAKE
jgi:riboflavin kinase/FMN adenylyltransferase